MNEDVARILGWTLECSGSTDELVDEWEVGDEWERQVLVGACPYTADDLAAWILERREWLYFNNAFDGDGSNRQWQASAANVDGDGYNEPCIDIDVTEATATTILGCLEQLVIQIGAS